MGKSRSKKAGGKGGKTFKPRACRGLPTGSIVICADNSGAKKARIISVAGIKTRLNRFPAASVGDMVNVAVQQGSPDMRRQLVKAIIVRQRRSYRRFSGSWVAFEDNAAVIVSDEGAPKGTEIRGPIAKEAAELWVDVAKIAGIIL